MEYCSRIENKAKEFWKDLCQLEGVKAKESRSMRQWRRSEPKYNIWINTVCAKKLFKIRTQWKVEDIKRQI